MTTTTSTKTIKDLLKENRMITKIDGQFYDVTDFAPKHPGGHIILGVCNGNDGSAMFHSSHFNLPDLASYPDIHKVYPTDDTIGKVRKANDDDFLNSLKKEVIHYFREKKIRYSQPTRTANLILFTLLSIWSVLFYFAYFKGSYLSCMLMGIITWSFPGFIVHDHGMHRFGSAKKSSVMLWFWSLVEITVYPFSFDDYALTAHCSHHSGVHSKDVDADDFLLYPLVRLSPEFEHKWWHSYQHLYWPLAFPFYLFFYVEKSTTGSQRNWWKMHNHNYRVVRNGRFEVLFGWLLFVHFILPMYNLGVFKGFFMYLIFIWIYSLGGLFFSICAHMVVNEKVDKQKDNNLWSYETIANSADVLPYSYFTYLITGGFSLHGIHHVLPSVHPSHLQTIYHIYKKKCEEFDYPLIIINDFAELFSRFSNYMYTMGRKKVE